MSQKLDALDYRILRELQNDGRTTNVTLSQRIGLSPPPCLRRVRQLEKNGIIKGYHAELDEQSLGFDVTAYAMVGLHNQAETDLRAFENQVLAWPIVRECYMLSGEMDYMLRCVTHDMASFEDFITRDLTSTPNVANVKTFMTIRRVKREPGVPLTTPPGT